MADIKISELERVQSLNNGDLVEVSQEDSYSETGYSSKSAKMTDLGEKVVNGIEYTSELNTSNKKIIGAINEIASYTPVYGNTASGAIATFDTSLALPLQDCTIAINAVQESGTPTPNSPKAISGFTGANVTRCGVNLMHVDSRVSQTTAKITYTSDDNYIYLNGAKYGAGFADLSNLTMTLPSGIYYLKAFVISGTASNSVSLYAFDGTNNISPNILGSEASMTLNKTTTFRFRFAIWTDGTVLSNYKIGIVISKASISENSEYNGSIYNIAFTDGDNPLTVYGGSLDVTSGVLTVTHVGYVVNGTQTILGSAANRFYISIPNAFKVDSTNQTTYSGVRSEILSPTTWEGLGSGSGNLKCAPLYGNGIAFRDDEKTTVADWVTYFTNNPTIFTYELATPQTIQLTPTQINTIVGTNNIFTDTNGDTSVMYACSLKDYIDNQ